MSVLKRYFQGTQGVQDGWRSVMIGEKGAQGAQGLQGDSAVGGFFLHKQLTAATVWEINHRLGAEIVVVQLSDLNKQSIREGLPGSPYIEFLDAGNIRVVFSSPQAGYAA